MFYAFDYPRLVTRLPEAIGSYIVFIEGLTFKQPNWWHFDGTRWNHQYIIRDGLPGMPGRRLFWIPKSYQPDPEG